MSHEIAVGSHTIQLSSLERVLFPDPGLTKADVIDYYRRMGPVMLPHMEGRPLTMHRFPEGIDEPGFYHKEVPDYFPQWIRRVEIMVEEEGATQPQITCDNLETLVYIANQSCITPHIWLSTVADLRRPDKLIFDLDPPGDDFESVRQAALDLRDVTLALDLVPFVMTTGSKGLHVVTPLKPTAPFDDVRAFARDIAALLVKRRPDRYTIEIRKKEREGRLFLDYLRNSYAQNSVAPYALRARAGAPVATPLDWDELGAKNLHSRRYHIKNIFRRLGQKDDPWREFRQHARSVEMAQARLLERRAEFD
ncbi:MAG: non-homologous end-joining DNA ligase [Chloroflexota bacterium]